MSVARPDACDATLARSIPSPWMGGVWWGRWIFFGLVVLLTDLRGAETPENDDFVKVRARVIIDNDFGGDPDGLFQLAHQLLSPSVEVRGVIGSHHYATGFYGNSGDAENACAAIRELMGVMNLAGKVPVYQGAEERIGEEGAAVSSEAALFIVREAMREDVKTPLYIACGAGLTDLASAYLLEPKIAPRIRLVWIGGHEHPGLASPPPGGQKIEYNLGIDLKAGQVVFNQSEIPIWQVPRDAYRKALVSNAELFHRMNEHRPLAGFLLGELRDLQKRAKGSLGETYVLGDNPLVLLTALQSSWEQDPSSCRYTSRLTPKISEHGLYEDNSQSRPMRIYTHLDTRLMFEDFFAKVALFDRRSETGK